MTLQKVVPIASINDRLHLAIHNDLTQQFKHSEIWVEAGLLSSIHARFLAQMTSYAEITLWMRPLTFISST